MPSHYFSRFNAVIGIIDKDWFDNVIRPYASAYIGACKMYDATVKRQHQIYQSRAEMLILGVSMLGGSALTALFGTSALKTLTAQAADKIALEVLSSKSLDRLFDAYMMLRNSPTASYVAGEALAALQKRGAAETKRDVERILSLQDGAASARAAKALAAIKSNPQEIQNELQSYSNSFTKAATLAALAIDDSTELTQAEKSAAIEAMFKSPGLRPPSCPVSYDARNLEFGFYLGLLVNSDQLCDFTSWNGHVSASNCAPIGVPPTQAGYPAWRTPLRTSFPGGAVKVEWTGVEMLSFGAAFRERIEVLHSIRSTDGFYGGPGGGREILVKAQETLEKLGRIRFAQPGPVRTALTGAGAVGVCDPEDQAIRTGFPAM